MRQKFENWNVVRTIGEGGQAKVHEVEDESGRIPGRYALKALSKSKPEQAYKRFAKEVQTIKRLSHDSIIKVIASSEQDASDPYYVMELIPEAHSLKKLIDRSKNPFYANPKKCIRFFHDLLCAITEWNMHHIVHRDLSPANILICDDCSIKVIDFGICQINDGDMITLIDEGVGTQNYMAPECESGSNSQVTIFADVYSAGKLLWTAATSRKAFGREESVFSDNSMKSIFPNQPNMWNLQEIFDRTIRHSRDDRAPMQDLVNFTHRLRRVIEQEFPHAEEVQHYCSVCGIGVLQHYDDFRKFTASRNDGSFRALQCDNCGYYCDLNGRTLMKKNENRRSFR